MRIAMVNQCYGVVALFVVVSTPFLLGTAAGESGATPGLDVDVPMINLSEELELYYNHSTYRPRERRLATAAAWCITRPNISDSILQTNLDWACGPLADQGQVNCGPIQVGGACYGNALQPHCDWAFNAYFQRMNASVAACDFMGAAQIVYTDPSYGNCTFPGSNITVNGTVTPTAPANSPGLPPGSPIYSPSAATGALEPRYLLRMSTAAILITFLFT